MSQKFLNCPTLFQLQTCLCLFIQTLTTDRRLLQQTDYRVFKRPGVAGAVLQSPPSFNWVSNPSVQISSKHCQSQTGKARQLKFFENVHPRYVSCVLCHVSCVTCHVSPVTCHMSHGGASWWRVSYQQGLPLLLFSRHVVEASLRNGLIID